MDKEHYLAVYIVGVLVLAALDLRADSDATRGGSKRAGSRTTRSELARRVPGAVLIGLFWPFVVLLFPLERLHDWLQGDSASTRVDDTKLRPERLPGGRTRRQEVVNSWAEGAGRPPRPMLPKTLRRSPAPTSDRPPMNDPSDRRTLADYPRLSGIAGIVDRDPKAALRKCLAQIAEDPAGDLGYFWAANCYLASRDTKAARRVLAQGVARSRRKSFLFAKLAEVCERNGDIVGWAAATVAAASAQVQFVLDAKPFLEIAEAAHGCRDEVTASRAESVAVREGVGLKADRKNTIRDFVHPHLQEVQELLATMVWPRL